MRLIPAHVLALFAAILVTAGAAAGGDFGGSVSVGGGYLAHPLGLLNDDAAGYATQALRLQLTAHGGHSSWRLGYEGSMHQFNGEQPLDQMRHALGLEWFGSVAEGRWRLSSGLQLTGRFQSDFYEPYSFTETTGYFAFKSYLSEGLLWRGYAQARYRRYEDLPEESFIEPSIQMELQRFLPSQTTVGAALLWGWKAHPDPAAERVWDTDGEPTTSLLRLRLNVAQSLSSRASLRANLLRRWSLKDFPHLVQGDLFDSPILDAYASSGTQVETTLRILGPWQVWLEPGVSYGEWDYGGSLFPGSEGAVGRRDEILMGMLSFDRTFSFIGSTRLKARMVVSWREQHSSLETYDLSGPDVTTALTWNW